MEWVDEFFNLLFSKRISLPDIERAYQLKDKNLPAELFQYRRCNDENIGNLERGTIWLSSPAGFNDPFDCAVSVDPEAASKDKWLNNLPVEFTDKHGITSDLIQEARDSGDSLRFLTAWMVSKGQIEQEEADAVVEAIGEVAGQTYKKMQEALFGLNHKGTMVSCFSTKNDSFLLWGHYAGKHSGFCVQYKPRGYSGTDLRVRLLYPVVYSTKRFDMTEVMKEGYTGDWNNLQPIGGVLTKSAEWEYEAEWRLAVTNGMLEEEQEWRFLPASAIYLGAKILPQHEARLQAHGQAQNIPVYKMTLDKREYRLVPELIL